MEKREDDDTVDCALYVVEDWYGFQASVLVVCVLASGVLLLAFRFFGGSLVLPVLSVVPVLAGLYGLMEITGFRDADRVSTVYIASLFVFLVGFDVWLLSLLG